MYGKPEKARERDDKAIGILTTNGQSDDPGVLSREELRCWGVGVILSMEV